MSQAPIDYYANLPKPPRERPISVTVMAIIGIILGALGFLCTPLSLIPYFISLPQQSGNPAFDAIRTDRLIFAWTMASSVVNWLLAIILLSGSIGALGLREWARQFLIAWSIMGVLVAIVGTIFNLLYLQPRIYELMRAQGNNSGATAGAIFGTIGMAMGLLFSFGFPIVMIFFMTRKNVKEAFARGMQRSL